MVGYKIVVPKEYAEREEFYKGLTGYDNARPEQIPKIVARNFGVKQGKGFEVSLKEDGSGRHSKNEVIAFCEENGIPYSIKEFNYINV